MGKRLLAGLLCLSLCLTFAPVTLAAGARDTAPEEALAAQLQSLGLFLGVGEKADGATDFDLNRAPNRAEALTMLVRALGKDAQAAAYPHKHPFTDVPSWAEGYVSYAYDKGLTKGISETKFGAADKVSGEMYLTFMLRALGYTEGEDSQGDFSWSAPWALATWCNILPLRVDQKNFLRADLVDITGAALFAQLKGSDKTLEQSLMAQGVFTQAQFDGAFPSDPFARDRLINQRISEAVAARYPLGVLTGNRYATAAHVIAEARTEGDLLKLFVFVCCGDMEITENNTIWSSTYSTETWVITLNAETLATHAVLTVEDVESNAWNDLVSDVVNTKLNGHMNPLQQVTQMNTQLQIAKGAFTYLPPTYEAALAKTKSGLTEVSKTLEAPSCTVLAGWLGGTPHGSYAYLYLVYKPSSAVGEGKVQRLPMPESGPFALTWMPDTLALSEDAKTLTYSYYFEPFTGEKVHIEGIADELLYKEPGTHLYTVNLETGAVTLDIIPPEAS